MYQIFQLNSVMFLDVHAIQWYSLWIIFKDTHNFIVMVSSGPNQGVYCKWCWFLWIFPQQESQNLAPYWQIWSPLILGALSDSPMSFSLQITILHANSNSKIVDFYSPVSLSCRLHKQQQGISYYQHFIARKILFFFTAKNSDIWET